MPLPRSIATSTFVGLIAALACAKSEISGPIPLLPYAAATNSCGPADGPAVSILLSANRDASEANPKYPLVRIMLWNSLEAVRGHRWTLGGDDGFAAYLPSQNESQAARTAVVTIDATTGNEVSGTVDLTFPGRDAIRGRFSATWTPRQILCG